MIPKIIHYCWFGKGEMPEKVKFCINSWKEKLPMYDFKLWNEDTFEIDKYEFTRDAYKNKKYAFVSDFVRVYALYNYGGIYLDTDIEVLKDFDDLLNNNIILGTDEGGSLTAMMGAVPKHNFFYTLLKKYEKMSFVKKDGSFEMTVNNIWIENELKKYGYKKANENQFLKGKITIMKDDYFHAKSLVSGKYHVTDNTYCIHHHTLLWIDKKTNIIKFLRMKVLVPLLGVKRYYKLVSILKGGNI
jgi:hypothetical protein